MSKTLYSCKIEDGKIVTCWFGDKLLRIAFVIANIIELALIIYLLVK